MPPLTEADRFLLDQVRRGDAEGWAQLVARYQGRLLAFARKHAGRGGEAEDLVQETFIGFLKGLPRFREQASLETYLFTILRRKIIDHLRGKRLSACLLQDAFAGEGGDDDAADRLAGDELTASRYVRRDEHGEHQRQALGTALTELVDSHKAALNFEQLMVVEMLFYAQARNRDIAVAVDVTEPRVALLKHRALKQLQQRAGEIMAERGWADQPTGDMADLAPASLITDIWEDLRPSCPKRSTLGSFLLDTLDADWQRYVEHHLHTLGCRFCLANVEDMKQQTEAAERDRIQKRLVQSTAGFLSRGT